MEPPDQRAGRSIAIDHLRGFIVAVVVLHHSVLAYCIFSVFDPRHYLLSTAPIVDSQRWRGFDGLVLVDDAFFMPLMFLISGLFLRRSLARKGAAGYLRWRLIRLGLPFAIAAATVVPLAYYPSFRMTGAADGFGHYWIDSVMSGSRPIGPPWFVPVLLAFEVIAVVTFRLAGRWRPDPGHRPPPPTILAFAALAALSALAYLPLWAVFGPLPWITVGPFGVQASRIGLYMLYFLFGVALGRGFADDRDGWSGRWAAWMGLAIGAACILLALKLAQEKGTLSPFAASVADALALVSVCAAGCSAALTAFLRFHGRRKPVWDSLAANAYGIFLIHYPFVTWAQYLMLKTPLSAPAKAAFVFSTALLSSWGVTVLLRRRPFIARVL